MFQTSIISQGNVHCEGEDPISTRKIINVGSFCFSWLFHLKKLNESRHMFRIFHTDAQHRFTTPAVPSCLFKLLRLAASQSGRQTRFFRVTQTYSTASCRQRQAQNTPLLETPWRSPQTQTHTTAGPDPSHMGSKVPPKRRSGGRPTLYRNRRTREVTRLRRQEAVEKAEPTSCARRSRPCRTC